MTHFTILRYIRILWGKYREYWYPTTPLAGPDWWIHQVSRDGYGPHYIFYRNKYIQGVQVDYSEMETLGRLCSLPYTKLSLVTRVRTRFLKCGVCSWFRLDIFGRIR